MEFSAAGSTTAINEVGTDETVISDVNSIITDSNTVIYDLQGRVIPQGSALTKGTYIVKNNKRTIKVNVR
jgi:hypothetical protein